MIIPPQRNRELTSSGISTSRFAEYLESVANGVNNLTTQSATNVTNIQGNTDKIAVNTLGIAALKANTDVYTVTNLSTDRTYDANTVLVAELADVLGTLIADLKSVGILP